MFGFGQRMRPVVAHLEHRGGGETAADEYHGENDRDADIARNSPNRPKQGV
jgi:hypothetical protein